MEDFSKQRIMKNLMNLRVIGALIAFIVSTLPAQAQQNIQFTQYIFNSMTVNPAYAGYKEDWFAQLALRSQWVGMDGAPKTGQVSVDGIIDPHHKRMGLGIQVTADKLGAQAATSLYANYAYRIKLDESDSQRLSFGIGLGLTQYNLNGSLLETNISDDPVLPAGSLSSYIPDLRFGVYYYNPKWYVGASVMDMLSGDQSNSIFRWADDGTQNLQRKRHFYLIAGTLIPLGEDMNMRPSILLKDDFKGPTSLDLNAMFIFGERFWIGGGYRTGMSIWGSNKEQDAHLSMMNSMSAITEFYVNDRLRVGYSYDYILSRLSSVQNGTHEITLGITFPGRAKRLLSPRYF